MAMKRALRMLLAAVMVGAGVMHFINPAPFVAMVPGWLPADPLWVTWVSGVCELVLGAALPWPRARRVAGFGLMALFVAVFPANLHMALHPQQTGGGDLAPWLLWARLPLQLVLIAWAWWVSQPDPPGSTRH